MVSIRVSEECYNKLLCGTKQEFQKLKSVLILFRVYLDVSLIEIIKLLYFLVDAFHFKSV
jgi:hypothetical protein